MNERLQRQWDVLLGRKKKDWAWVVPKGYPCNDCIQDVGDPICRNRKCPYLEPLLEMKEKGLLERKKIVHS